MRLGFFAGPCSGRFSMRKAIRRDSCIPLRPHWLSSFCLVWRSSGPQLRSSGGSAAMTRAFLSYQRRSPSHRSGRKGFGGAGPQASFAEEAARGGSTCPAAPPPERGSAPVLAASGFPGSRARDLAKGGFRTFAADVKILAAVVEAAIPVPDPLQLVPRRRATDTLGTSACVAAPTSDVAPVPQVSAKRVFGVLVSCQPLK